jgi:malate dehydrogenase
MWKISIIGAGALGGAVADRLLQAGSGEVVLVDGDASDARGRALDAATAAALRGDGGWVHASDDWRDLAGSTAVVIAGGDATAVRVSATQVAEHAPDAMVVVAAEPMEALTDLVAFTTLFPRQRVAGVGGVIDSARLRALVAAEVGASARDVWALVVGEHGDTMVPLLSSASVAGAPVAELIAAERLEEIARRVRERPALDDLQARAAAAAHMVDGVMADRRRVVSCCVLCEGELGLERVCIDVPVRLGAGGVEEIVAVPMSDAERVALAHSADVVRERVAALLGAG